jgi:hypothetical protein
MSMTPGKYEPSTVTLLGPMHGPYDVCNTCLFSCFYLFARIMRMIKQKRHLTVQEPVRGPFYINDYISSNLKEKTYVLPVITKAFHMSAFFGGVKPSITIFHFT